MQRFAPAAGFSRGVSLLPAPTAAAAFLPARLAGLAAVALTSGGSMPGTQRSMLRRVALKLTTTRSTDSPSFIISLALRGGGSDISRNGT